MSSSADLGMICSRSVSDELEIVETCGLRTGYTPHSHDHYVVGVTIQGLQRFRYRGEEKVAEPGEAFVLHPGETHDGRPGTRSGYGYRSIHIPARCIADVSEGRSLPFVKDAVSKDSELIATIARLLGAEDSSHADLRIAEGLSDLTCIFARLAGRSYALESAYYPAISRIREQIHFEWRSTISIAGLEVEHGLSRYTIAREFRRYFGVSPSRYVVLRRIRYAKHLIVGGHSLADTAVISGFSDQSHMTCHFLKSVGMTPGRWRTLHRSVL